MASITGREWSIGCGVDDLPLDLADRVLLSRGIDRPGQAALRQSLGSLFPDPWSFRNMKALCGRLALAVERGESVGIFGDYDVDGACSSAIMAEVLEALGCRVVCHIPDRVLEGYGPNAVAIEAMAAAGCAVVLCVDCGSAAGAVFRQVHLERPGLDILVLDHHRVDHAVQDCIAVNPNAPGCGSGMAYLCAGALALVAIAGLRRLVLGRERPFPVAVDTLTDLAALATVCDVMPILGFNRALVRAGLAQARKGSRPGLAAITRAAGVEVARLDSGALGFAVGPRINAGGRIGVSGAGLALLREKEPDAAWTQALVMDQANRRRRSVGAEVLEQAMEKAREQCAAGAAVMVVHDPSWHVGVVGIVAGRLREAFNRPALVFGSVEGQDLAKGSGRSVPEFDLGAAVIRAVHEGRLAGGGGHAMAAGCSARPDSLAGLSSWFTGEWPLLASRPVHTVVAVDCLAGADDLSVASAEALATLEPFGNGFPVPLLCLPSVVVSQVRLVGRDATTLSFLADVPSLCSAPGSNGVRVKCVAFGAVESGLAAAVMEGGSDRFDLVGELSVNEWNGTRSAQMVVRDAAIANRALDLREAFAPVAL